MKASPLEPDRSATRRQAVRRISWSAIGLALAACAAPPPSPAPAAKPTAAAPAPAPTTAPAPAAKATAAPAKAPAQVRKIKYITALASYDLGQIFLYVPTGLGYFAEEGIEVEFVPNATGSTAALQALVTGNVEAANVSPGIIFDGLANGMRMNAVYGIVHRSIFQLAVLDNSPIKALTDLKGKTVGVLAFGSDSFFDAKFAIKEAGLDPEKDVTFLPVGAGGPAIDALKTGKIDATSSWDTQFPLYDAAGLKLRKIKYATLDGLMLDPVLVRPETLEKDRQLVIGLGRGMAKGVEFALANPKATLAIYKKTVTGTYGNVPDDVLLKIVENRLENLKPPAGAQWGLIRTEDYQKWQQLLLSFELLKRPVDLQAFVRNDLVPEFNKFDRAAVQAQAKAYPAG